MVRIGIDACSNDNGKQIFIDAAYKYVSKNRDVKIYLYSDDNILVDEKFINQIEVVKCEDIIAVEEHPVFSLRTKKKSSLYLAGNDLNDNKIDVLISAGSTGAVLALGQLYIKTLENVKRPAIATVIPTETCKTIVIDSGANMDPEPEWLVQYAILGSIYYEEMFSKKPRVGLLNVGVEKTKGNKLTTEVYELLSKVDKINFVGNIEARDVPKGVCDVLVCDGFSGNVLLKMYEGTAKSLLNIIKNIFKKNIFNLMCAAVLKSSFKSVLKEYDAREYGGAILIGTRKLIIKCHGNAKSNEIYVALSQAYDFVKKDINKKFKDIGGNYGI